MTTVAVIGTGRMGGAMARRLASSGLAVIVHNRTRARAEEIAAAIGAQVADSAAEAAGAADVTITMLANDEAVTSTFTGPDGVVDGARPGTVLVDMSTVMPDTLRRVADRVRETGAGLLDAPVSGSVSLAESGGLTLMVGGDAADLDRARPALEPLARTIFHLGPLGSGAAMKLAVNTVIFGLNEAVAEGLVLAEAAGIDRERAYDVIAASAVGAPYVGYKRNAFISPATTPVAFALELAEKDLRLITALAGQLGVPIPQASANVDVIRAAMETQGNDRDFADVATYLRMRRRDASTDDHAPAGAAAPRPEATDGADAEAGRRRDRETTGAQGGAPNPG